MMKKVGGFETVVEGRLRKLIDWVKVERCLERIEFFWTILPL